MPASWPAGLPGEIQASQASNPRCRGSFLATKRMLTSRVKGEKKGSEHVPVAAETVKGDVAAQAQPLAPALLRPGTPPDLHLSEKLVTRNKNTFVPQVGSGSSHGVRALRRARRQGVSARVVLSCVCVCLTLTHFFSGQGALTVTTAALSIPWVLPLGGGEGGVELCSHPWCCFPPHRRVLCQALACRWREG